MVKARRVMQRALNLDKKKRFKNITTEEEGKRQKERMEEAAKAAAAPSVIIKAGRKNKKLITPAPSVVEMNINDQDWDKMSCLTSMSKIGSAQSSKFSRLLEKKEKLYTKIDKVEGPIKKAKNKKKNKKYLKQKKLLVGDLNDLKDALPNLDFLMEKLNSKKEDQERLAKSKKEKHLHQRMMNDVAVVNAVASNTEIRDNIFDLLDQNLAAEKHKQKFEIELSKAEKKRNKQKSINL